MDLQQQSLHLFFFAFIVIFQVRLPPNTSDDVDEDPTGNKALWDRGLLNGASQKVKAISIFIWRSTLRSPLWPVPSASRPWRTLASFQKHLCEKIIFDDDFCILVFIAILNVAPCDIALLSNFRWINSVLSLSNFILKNWRFLSVTSIPWLNFWRTSKRLPRSRDTLPLD